MIIDSEVFLKGLLMNKTVSVPFDIVEIWYNDYEAPYTLKPTRKDSKKEYAIKIGENFFPLGGENDSLFICDYKYPKDTIHHG